MSAAENIHQDFFTNPVTSTPAVGEVYAVRSFSVEPTGHLTGVTYRQRWSRADNTAECHLADDRSERPEWAPAWSMWSTHQPERYSAKAGHAPGSDGCTCGFYAYWTGEDCWGMPQRVTGVIAAWGVVTAGTKGIRAQHARIVALVKPREPWVEQGWFDGTPTVCHRPGVQPLTWQRVVERFADLPIFASLEAALDEFPPTPLRPTAS